MKWTHVGWLLAGLLTASASLRAADVTLTVNGKVVARPCTCLLYTSPSPRD